MDGDKEMVKYKIAIKEMEKITLKIPGGMYVHVPSEVTTTFVGKVPSKASLALMQNGLFTDSLCKLYICDANLTQVCMMWQKRHFETLGVREKVQV